MTEQSVHRNSDAWLVIFLVPLFLYFTVNNMLDFVQQPYVTTNIYVALDETLLPRLTICPSIWMNEIALEQSGIAPAVTEYIMNGFLDGFLSNVPYHGNVTEAEVEAMYNETLSTNPNFDPRHHLVRMQELCTSSLQSCYINGETHDTEVCCNDYSKPNIITNLGMCISLEGKELVQNKPGPGGGISLELQANIKIPSTMSRTLSSTGFVLMVDDYPAVTRPSPIAVGADDFIIVGLRPKRYVSVSNCVDRYQLSDFFNETKHKHQSKQLCLYDCVVNMIRAECGCVPFTEGINADTQMLCSPKQTISCVHPITSNIGRRLSHCERQCPKQCDFSTYDYGVTYAKLNKGRIRMFEMRMKDRYGDVQPTTSSPEMKRRKRATGDFGPVTKELKPQTSILTIYMADIGYELFQEEATDTWHSLVANVGGQMGMWLGVSVLSVKRFVEVCLKNRKTTK